MCGIVGLSLANNHASAEPVVQEMGDRIRHRGPDSGGYLAGAFGRAHVGFRRLAIRDLNPRANQPMLSASGRTAIVFNGEIYNSAQLADKYLSHQTLSTSGDTEVVLEAIEKHGLSVLPELNGMFAMAVVDMKSEKVTLVRDRMGKKPLYVYEEQSRANSVVAFASEVRSLRPFGLDVDPRHAALFFHFGYFPSPYTFFRNTTQVCPGEVVQLEHGRVTDRFRYHDFTQQDWGTGDVSLDALSDLFADSIRLRRLSDVPVGAFLSGGIDSALVAAYAGATASSALSNTNENEEPLPTFTVKFADQAHDEASDAVVTAQELGLPHTVIEIEEGNLADLAMDYVDCYEQPYADSSGLVTMLLCRAVKEHVTVALSGDGGDEFYGGYARYSWFKKALALQRFPGVMRRLAGLGLTWFDQRRGQRLARWLAANDPAGLYFEIKRTWNSTDLTSIADTVVASSRDSVRPLDMVRDVFDRTSGDELAKAACFDATHYIPDDLQVKLDRASMQVALEVRCPLLDFRIANMGLGLNSHAKYANGLKGTLKELLGRHVSPAVLNRPKHGFNVPLARWLSGPMKSLVAESLSQKHVREAGWIHADTVGEVWKGFQRGQSEHALSVWMLFNLCQQLQTEPANASFRELLDAPARKAA